MRAVERMSLDGKQITRKIAPSSIYIHEYVCMYPYVYRDFRPHWKHSLPACHSHLWRWRCHGNLIKPLCRWLFNRWSYNFASLLDKRPLIICTTAPNVKHLGGVSAGGRLNDICYIQLFALINKNGPNGWAGDKEPHPQLAHFFGGFRYSAPFI